MTEKKKDPKRQTKAGMMGKTGSEEDNGKDKTTAKNESEKMPKMSKKEAETGDRDKPLH